MEVCAYKNIVLLGFYPIASARIARIDELASLISKAAKVLKAAYVIMLDYDRYMYLRSHFAHIRHNSKVDHAQHNIEN